MNEEFHEEVKALHQADCDQRTENLNKLYQKEVSMEDFLEQQALICRLFKTGMENVAEKAGVITKPTKE